MGIRENLAEILANYTFATSEPLTGHALAQRIRRDFPSQIRWIFPEDSLLLVKRSAGQGAWVRGPWIALFDRLVTESAQSGFYPVYLFSEDMSGVYLSLNQGMTEIKRSYRADAKTTLRARAANFRAMLGPKIQPFIETAINLAPGSVSNDTAFYEAGNVCSIYYPADQLPSEEVLNGHLHSMLQLYRSLIDAGAADDMAKQDELEIFHEGGEPPRVHLRIERNRKLAARVKKLKGATCEACQMTFAEKYGKLGSNFIEAHHKVPFAALKNQKIPLDPRTDFAVLCANCHRMAHRMDDPADIDALRTIIKTCAS